jgi:hypothetical protein
MSKLKIVMALILTLVVILSGCTPNNDQRLAEMAAQHEARQVQQNQQLAELQEHVAEGSKELVAADARAREQAATLARELQAERAKIGEARDVMESERRELARQRHRDPIVAEAIAGAALLVACVLPLVVCRHLLRQPENTASADVAAAELLLQDLVAERPLLSPRPLPAAIDFDGDSSVDAPSSPPAAPMLPSE